MSENRVHRLLGSLADLSDEPAPAFVDRLRRQVHDTASADSHPPVEPAQSSAEEPILITPATDSANDENVGGSRAPRWFLAAAVVVLIIGIGTAVYVTGDDGSGTMVSSSGLDELGERFAAAEDLASRFLVAYDRADRDAVMSLLADDAPFQFNSQSISVEEIGPQVALSATWQDHHELLGCEAWRLSEPGDPVQVTCRTRYSNRLTHAVGGVPVDGTFYIRVEGEEITAIRAGIDTEAHGPMVWQPYLSFVQDRAGGGDFGQMFESHPDGWGIIGPKLTEESVALHARYTAEFEAANDGS